MGCSRNVHIFKAIINIIFSDFKREKTLTILSIVGVSLGISLYISVNIATNRGIQTFTSDVYSLSEGYNYEIIPVSGRFIPNEVYETLLKKTFNISPVITINSVLDVPQQEHLKLYGIDMFTIKANKLFNQLEGNLKEFFTHPHSLFINNNFAKAHNININDSITLIISDKKYTFVVAGFFSSEFLPENSIFLDIAHFQEIFNIYGLSRIDILLKDPNEISNLLPSNVMILEKNEILHKKEGIVKSFTYNLKFISFIAILVGFFILYNAVFTSTVKSIPAIGILRCIGFKRRHILLLFLIKGTIIGLTGSIIGIFFAQFLSVFSISMAEKTISTIYAPISIYNVSLDVLDILQAIFVAIATSIIASLIPAYEASKVNPISATSANMAETKFAVLYNASFISGLCLIFIGIFISFYEYVLHPFDYPFFSYIGVFLIIFGFTFVTPLYLKRFLTSIDKLIKRSFPLIGTIALNDIKGSLHRFSIALISVMISSALIISFFVLIYSFKQNLTAWIDKNLTFDVFIKPSSCSSNFCFEGLSPQVINVLKDFTEIDSINRFRTLQGFYNGKPTLFGFANESVVKKHTHNIIDPYIGKRQEVAASEYFATKYKINVGDFIVVHTPEGPFKFKVREIFKSYSSTLGFLIFDRYWLKKLWHIDDATQLNIYLKENIPANEFIEKLKSKLPPALSVDIYDNKRLKARILEIFDRTFAITYAIQIIAFIISLIGMINTIFTIIIEKSKNISILRYIGCSHKKIKSIFLCSASIVGFSGIFLGLILGSIISFIMIKTINTISFGWAINISIPYFSITYLLFILYITIIVSVFIPVAYIKKIDIKKSISL